MSTGPARTRNPSQDFPVQSGPGSALYPDRKVVRYAQCPSPMFRRRWSQKQKLLAGLFDGPQPPVQPLESGLEQRAPLAGRVGAVAAQLVVDRLHRVRQLVAHHHVRLARVQHAHVHAVHRLVDGRALAGRAGRRPSRRIGRRVGGRGHGAAVDGHGERGPATEQRRDRAERQCRPSRAAHSALSNHLKPKSRIGTCTNLTRELFWVLKKKKIT